MTTTSGPWPFDAIVYFDAPAFIVQDTCRLFDIRYEVLTSATRFPSIVYARNLCIYVIRQCTKLSFEEVGLIFGKHHTTIMHSVDWVKRRNEIDPMMQDHLSALIERVNFARTSPVPPAPVGEGD